MGFNEIKKKAVDCIKEGRYKNDKRDLEKNLFANRLLTEEDLLKIINSCNGDCYEVGKHHHMEAIPVHKLKPIGRYDGLYVKFYFLEPNIVFISVHY